MLSFLTSQRLVQSQSIFNKRNAGLNIAIERQIAKISQPNNFPNRWRYAFLFNTGTSSSMCINTYACMAYACVAYACVAYACVAYRL